MKVEPIQPRITLGYVGGSEPYICAVETAWPNPEKEPIYNARMSRKKGFQEVKALATDPRVGLCTIVAFTDEVEAEEIGDLGFDIQWCRVINGPGTEREAQVLVNIAEPETILRRLAEQKRLRFPKTMGALGRRAGGELASTDHELLAFGLACWYAVQTHDRTRSQPKHPKEPLPWDENEIPDPEREGELSDLMDSLATRRHPLSRL